MHETLSTGLPVLAVVMAAAVNRYDITDVGTEIRDLRAEIKASLRPD